jgi:hypothetical protein
MSDEAEIREQLDRMTTWDSFFECRQTLVEWESEVLYQTLFPLAICGRMGNAPHRAGCLLLELQPNCPDPLPEIVKKIHASKWYVSFREVPFYLVTQFGKHAVLDEARRFVSSLPENRAEHSRVSTLIYWASFPATELCRGFHEWVDSLHEEADKNA